jgi:micrococcal nuclease
VDPAYIYRARCERVIDGDTIYLRVDLGFHVAATISGRLYGVNAPERGDPGGPEATGFLRDLLFLPTNGPVPLVVRTYKDRRSFDRWVVEVWLEDGRNVADLLVEAGHAVRV